MTFIELKATTGEVWVQNTDTSTTYRFALLGDPRGDYTLAPSRVGHDEKPITSEQDEEAEAAKAFANSVVKRMGRNEP